MRVLNKQQIQIIMLLNGLLLVLICSVIFIYGGFIKPSAETNAPPSKVPHSIIRAARNSAHPNISYETNIGGSKTERLVASFFVGEKIYVFANSDSDDYDLVGKSGKSFGAILAASGNTVSFVKFDFALKKVLPIDGGFVACASGDDSGALLRFNTDLTLIKQVKLPSSTSQNLLDLYIYDDCFFVVGKVSATTPKTDSVIVSMFDKTLTPIAEKITLSPFSVEYICLLPYKNGKYILASNIISQTDNYMCIFTFSRTDDIIAHNIKMQLPYKASGFAPFNNGYASLIPKADGYELIGISNELIHVSSRHYANLDESCEQARLLRLGGAPIVYLPSLACAHQYNDTLTDFTEQKLELTDISAVSRAAKSALILGKSDSAYCLLAISDMDKSQRIKFATYSENAKILPLSDGIIIVSEQTALSCDAPKNFGDSDIWITKLHY